MNPAIGTGVSTSDVTACANKDQQPSLGNGLVSEVKEDDPFTLVFGDGYLVEVMAKVEKLSFSDIINLSTTTRYLRVQFLSFTPWRVKFVKRQIFCTAMKLNRKAHDRYFDDQVAQFLAIEASEWNPNKALQIVYRISRIDLELNALRIVRKKIAKQDIDKALGSIWDAHDLIGILPEIARSRADDALQLLNRYLLRNEPNSQQSYRDLGLFHIASEVVNHDAQKGLQIARQISAELYRCLALRKVAAKIAKVDGKKEALRIADEITRPDDRRWLFGAIVTEIARHDIEEAWDFAESISEHLSLDWARCYMVTAVARDDVENALKIAEEIQPSEEPCQDDPRDASFLHLAEKFSESDVELALKIADKISHESYQYARALRKIAPLVAKSNAQRALILADKIAHIPTEYIGGEYCEACFDIAAVVAETDLEGATTVAKLIEDCQVSDVKAYAILDSTSLTQSPAVIASELAKRNVLLALQYAESIKDPADCKTILHSIVQECHPDNIPALDKINMVYSICRKFSQ